jgi:hypothetical protein
VKKHADFVTTDIDDDGIYNALKYFQIIDWKERSQWVKSLVLI